MFSLMQSYIFGLLGAFYFYFRLLQKRASDTKLLFVPLNCETREGQFLPRCPERLLLPTCCASRFDPRPRCPVFPECHTATHSLCAYSSSLVRHNEQSVVLKWRAKVESKLLFSLWPGARFCLLTVFAKSYCPCTTCNCAMCNSCL